MRTTEGLRLRTLSYFSFYKRKLPIALTNKAVYTELKGKTSSCHADVVHRMRSTAFRCVRTHLPDE